MEFQKSKSLDPVDEEGEEWFYIHPDITDYQFSNHGRLKSLKFGREKILKFSLTNKGYLHTVIIVNKKRIDICKHHCACLALNNPYEKYCYDLEYILKNYNVNHINGNRANNNTSNLELVTSIENCCICKNDGRILELEEAIEIFKLSHASGLSGKEIATLYKINQWNVTDIKTGRSWSNYTYDIDTKNIKPWEIERILEKFNKIERNKFQEADLNDFF